MDTFAFQIAPAGSLQPVAVGSSAHELSRLGATHAGSSFASDRAATHRPLDVLTLSDEKGSAAEEIVHRVDVVVTVWFETRQTESRLNGFQK